MELSVMAVVSAVLVFLVFVGRPLQCEQPAVVKVGAVFTFDSVIGRGAKIAMEMAVEDINSDPRILNGTQLRMVMEDPKCSAFMGSVQALQMIEKEVVAIVGPQSSAIACIISHIANGLHIPVISYAATNPTLSSLQFPYFLRTTATDSNQMAAVADIIDFYDWKEIIAVFVDNDYGRNGVTALGHELARKRATISYKLPLCPEYNISEISDVLNKSKALGPRVYVVHIDPDPSLKFFRIVKKLDMITSNYIWLTTDWLSSTLDSLPGDRDSLEILQGVVTLRPYIPNNPKKKAFMARWRNMQLKAKFTTYGLYAYDTMWLVARSIDRFLKENGGLTFSLNNKLQLGNLKVFDGGELLLKFITSSNFTGLTGKIQFDADRNRGGIDYEIINVVKGTYKVGYWSNETGLSIQSPKSLKGNKVRKLVPYEIPFRFEPFGDGLKNPNYDELVRLVADGVFDAAVGDIAITTNRIKLVDFTQPFWATGLVVVAPIVNSTSSGWVFVKPFTLEMWCSTAASFVIIAVVIWRLEHRVNDDFRGPPRRQLKTMFLFSFSTLFKANYENPISTLGRIVMVVWLFLLLVITSSYTASLSSILTVQQLSTGITGIDSLISSGLPVGYQEGSFAYSYLKNNLNIHASRLISLGSREEYESALRRGPKNGGVAAIVDETPYVELFLSTQTDFGILGLSFTRSAWGFAFRKDSPLAGDMSTAILKLTESGQLQKIKKKWFCKSGCSDERRRKPEPKQLNLSSFWALYSLCGTFALMAFFLFLIRAIRQYIRYKSRQMDPSSPTSSISSSILFSQAIHNFLKFIDEKEEAIKKMFAQPAIPPTQSLNSEVCHLTIVSACNEPHFW
ncbi:UNVERIFIED_CONTAM: Glutamate receptor 3.7 [Sesamum radiatum]|uniref:Glutamate receptor n=1 Tax=Sesamum radiatum TaxID=300843 RepID=A0AAW2K4V6_SESRA